MGATGVSRGSFDDHMPIKAMIPTSARSILVLGFMLSMKVFTFDSFFVDDGNTMSS